MTEDFLNTPLGAQDDSMNAYLRKKDPDAMMLNLGMTLSGDHEAITSGGGGGGDNLSISSGGQAPPAVPPQALLLGEGQEQAAAAASGNDGPAGVPRSDPAVPGDGTPPPPPPPPSSSSTLPPMLRQAAGTYGPSSSSSPSSPAADLPPSVLSSMMAGNGVGEAAGAGTARAAAMSPSAAAAQDFTFLMRTLGAHGRFEEARGRVMPEMRRRGIAPNDGTFAALLAGAAVDRNPDAAEEVREQACRVVITPPLVRSPQNGDTIVPLCSPPKGTRCKE